MKRKKKELNKYNPYIYLALNDNYIDEVKVYYDNYNEIYGGSKAFIRRIINTNNEAIKWAIDVFLSGEDDIKNLTEQFRENIRKIKDIILITEKGTNINKRINFIDKKVTATIDYKTKLVVDNRSRLKVKILKKK